MKLSQLSAAFFTILMLVFVTSCEDDDNEVLPANVTIADFSTTIVENPADGAVLGTPTATTDRGTIIFSLTDQVPANAMSIDAASGELTVADVSLFNFEVNSVLTATISATVESVTETAQVTVNLEDIAETVNVTPFAITIDENPANGTNLGAVSATSDAGATLTYALVAGGNAAALSIDADNGELLIVDNSLFDYETNPVVTATFEVSNGVATEQGSITITLNDVADGVTANTFSVTIDENPTAGMVLGTVSATSAIGGTLSYSLVTGDNATAFAIDASTGELTVTDAAQFDFETNPTLTATYEANDGTVSGQGSITITLNDLPDFVTTSPFSVTIDENPIVGQVLGTVSATSDAGATLTYSLVAGDNALAFAINASTGELTVADASQFDYEATQTLSATYTADNGTVSAQGTITVSLNDLDDSSLGLVTATADFSARSYNEMVAFNAKMFLIGGVDASSNSDEVWSSTDGVTWINEQATGQFGHFSERRGQTVTVFNNMLWVIGGRDNSTRFGDVWSSVDGKIWNQNVYSAPFGTRTDHTTVVFNNKLWVIGGTRSSSGIVENDVWSSPDGVNWTEEVGFGPFSGRYNHTSLVFDNKLWIIGGEGSNLRADKVWSSTDGINWVESNTNAEFTSSASHTSVVFGGKIWRIGGKDQNGYTNDVWSSVDGATWVKERTAPAFSARINHGSVVYNNLIWLVGGFDGANHKNDVWVIAE